MRAAALNFATYPLLLAALPDTPAGRAGYVAGFVFAGVLMLCVMSFAISAVIMAFVRRTTGWIVTGSIMGCFVLVAGVSFAVAVAAGVMQGVRAGVSGSGAAQTVVGDVLPYSIQLPPGWTAKRHEGVYDLLANRGGNFISVIAEEGNRGLSENIAEVARQRIKATGTDVEMGEPESIMIDGRQWVQFTVKCKIKLIPFAYQFYVYTGREGTFQIIGWTFQNLWDRESAKLRESMLTFRFAPPASLPQDAAPRAARSQ